jgi:shikimate dehydrogenase
MRIFGLIGHPLAQSFSKKYFSEKFLAEGIENARYDLYELHHITQFPLLVQSTPDLRGLNVTIPYKQAIIPYLDSLDGEAKKIGACNCILFEGRELLGFNTDAPAFENSLKPLLCTHHQRALILGTGGASKAVQYVLKKLNIEYKVVSRAKKDGCVVYEDLTKDIMDEYLLIINTTPLGSYPKVDTMPDIPFQFITSEHYLYDLVYNPEVTLFLQKGRERGAIIKNGYDMLVGQAELSWQIWNK